MIPYLSATGNLDDYGLGKLTDCLDCKVTEEARGVYELEMSYPATGVHAADIDVERFIVAKPNYTDSPQIFKIYRISKAINGVFLINAEHISYALNGYVVLPGTAMTALDASALLSEGTPFSITTDKSVSALFKVNVPSSVRSWFYGREGSLVDVFGTAEFHFDNYNITWNLHKGQNRGVSIRYGKNLTSLSKDRDSSNLVSAVVPYWTSTDGDVVVGGEVSTGIPGVRQFAYDCSSFFETAPTEAQLRTRAESYIATTILTEAKENITLDFIQIGQLKDRVDLYDIVNIHYEALGVNATAKCIRTKWDVLTDRYVEITLGEPSLSIADTILQVEKTANDAANKSITMMQEAIDHATQLITGNLGGHVVIHDSNGDGEPDEILVMDTDDINTATRVWRWNTAGLGYSSTGYSGTYGLAMTMDGQIVADFIKTGELDGALIKADSVQAESISTSFLTDASSAGGVIYQAFTAADGVLNSRIENRVSVSDFNDKVGELEGQLGSNYTELKQTASNLEISIGGVEAIANGKADGGAFDSLKEKIDARFTFGASGLEIRGIPNATAGMYTRIDSDSYDIMAEGQDDPIASFGAVATIPNLKIGNYLFKRKSNGAFQIVWEA